MRNIGYAAINMLSGAFLAQHEDIRVLTKWVKTKAPNHTWVCINYHDGIGVYFRKRFYINRKVG